MMVATVVGGQGSADSPGPNDAAIADGFLGLALRRVSDGAYVDFVRNPCNGGCGHAETISISKQGDPGEQYTIDVIDNYNGGDATVPVVRRAHAQNYRGRWPRGGLDSCRYWST